MVERACPVCGSTDASRLFAQERFDAAQLDEFAFASRKIPEYMHYRLIECRSCDLVYASPIPSLEAISSAYHEASFDSGAEAEYASQTYAAHLPQIQRRLPDLRGALDIGTGDGAFLDKLLAAGFSEIMGIEPSAAPISAARSDLRPLIRHGMFPTDECRPESLSLITCFQTIEHVYDPLATARTAIRLLKPGGAFFMICHDRRSIVNRALGAKSPIRDVEHLQLFSPMSAKRLLKESGYINVDVRPIVNRYPLSYWLRLLPMPRRLKVGLINALDRIGLGKVMVALRVGNLAVIGYKPRADSIPPF
jgi:SAM-dependent methyltransferase